MINSYVCCEVMVIPREVLNIDDDAYKTVITYWYKYDSYKNVIPEAYFSVEVGTRNISIPMLAELIKKNYNIAYKLKKSILASSRISSVYYDTEVSDTLTKHGIVTKLFERARSIHGEYA